MAGRESKLSATRASVNNVVGRILERTIDRRTFISYVSEQWDNCRFVSQCDYHNSTLEKKVELYARLARPTFHGRANQLLSTCRQLFGGIGEISGRLVFDPPTNKVASEGIEPHTHPVASLIVVTQGGGDFFLLFSQKKRIIYVRAPLTIGTVVCFPAGVIHTMQPGSKGIQTLNVTDRENLPPLRGTESSKVQEQSELKGREGPFSIPEVIPKEAVGVDYADILCLVGNF